MATKSLENSLKERLIDLRAHIRKDPLSNPVRQIAYEVSKDIEANRLTLPDIGQLIKTLSDEAFQIRAQNLRTYLDSAHTSSATMTREIITTQSEGLTSIGDFNAHWVKRRDVIVFTGHPTFILSAAQREALTCSVSDDNFNLSTHTDDMIHMPDDPITLTYEHQAVLDAITHATTAISNLNRQVIAEARVRFPDDWKKCAPSPVNLASWVGYDMDGRNDIGWHDVILHRLIEKQYRLEWYAKRLQAIGIEGNKGS